MHTHTEQDQAYGLAGLLTAPVGYLVLLFLPVYLEVVAASLQLTEQQIGRLASADSIGLVLATIVFALWVNKINFRHVTFAGVLIAVAGNFICAFVDHFETLYVLRILCGVGEGLLVAVGISALGMTSAPNRWFGYYTATVVLVQALGLIAVPLLYKAGGLYLVFVTMAGFYLLPLLVVNELPQRSHSAPVVESSERGQAIGARWFVLALLGLLSFYIGLGGVWSYISFLATDAGLQLDSVSRSLALSMTAGLLGALFFAWLNEKGKSSALLFFSFALMSGCLLALLNTLSDMRYLALLSVFSFFWSVVGARTFAIISDVDHSGKFISMAQACVGIGYIIGPMFASQLLLVYSYPGVNLLGIAAFILCFVLMLPLARRGR